VSGIGTEIEMPFTSGKGTFSSMISMFDMGCNSDNSVCIHPAIYGETAIGAYHTRGDGGICVLKEGYVLQWKFVVFEYLTLS
jgi:hypothetical protein